MALQVHNGAFMTVPIIYWPLLMPARVCATTTAYRDLESDNSVYLPPINLVIIMRWTIGIKGFRSRYMNGYEINVTLIEEVLIYWPGLSQQTADTRRRE